MNQDQIPFKKRRPSFLRRVLTFLVTLALVLGAVFLILHYDQLNFDAVRRRFSYRSLERSDNGQTESFSYGEGRGLRFLPVGSDLLVCSENAIRLYSGGGGLYIDETVSLAHPAADSAGSYALVYDAGGQQLFAVSGREMAWNLTLEEGRSLLSASVNPSGYAAVTSEAEESGFKGAVTVYDPAGSPVMQVKMSSGFVMDAALSPDSETLAVLTVGLDGGNFESRLSFYSLDRQAGETEPAASCTLGNQVVLALQWADQGLWCLGESEVALVSGAGEALASSSYAGRFLKEFSLEGADFAAVLTGKYRAGSSAELTVVEHGGARRTLPVEEQVLSLSSAGRYIAVLTADRLDIYTKNLELYDILEGTQSARTAIMRPDGSVMLIGSETARLYVPQ